MDNKLEIFKSEQFGEVRTILIGNEPWFVAIDVCAALSISNNRDAVGRLDDDEKMTVDLTDSHSGVRGGAQKISVVNESGLYTLVLSSRKPEAKAFKRWITHEVIPIIRKTGGYIDNVELLVETYFSDAPEDHKTIFKGLFSNIQALQNKNNLLNKENDLLAQKVIEWADRPFINAIVRAYGASLGSFSQGWTDFKKELLYKYGINVNSRITNYLNSTGKKTKPRTLEMLDATEIPNAVSTAIALCRSRNVDISAILKDRMDGGKIGA